MSGETVCWRQCVETIQIAKNEKLINLPTLYYYGSASHLVWAVILLYNLQNKYNFYMHCILLNAYANYYDFSVLRQYAFRLKRLMLYITKNSRINYFKIIYTCILYTDYNYYLWFFAKFPMVLFFLCKNLRLNLWLGE